MSRWKARGWSEGLQGILAGGRGIGVDDAFALLHHHSRDHNLRLTELGHAVVNLGLHIPAETD